MFNGVLDMGLKSDKKFYPILKLSDGWDIKDNNNSNKIRLMTDGLLCLSDISTRQVVSSVVDVHQ